MLGFAMRAGKVVIGTDLVCHALAKSGSGSAKLVLVASTASDGTKKKLLKKSEYYKVRAIVTDIDSSELGRLLGKLYAPSAVAITDKHFAEEIARASDGQRDQTTQRKEVSDTETGDPYASITNKDNTDI